jgi:hypothetical protein
MPLQWGHFIMLLFKYLIHSAPALCENNDFSLGVVNNKPEIFQETEIKIDVLVIIGI